MLPNELKETDRSGRRGTLVRTLRAQSSKQLMPVPKSVGDESDETKGDAIKRSTTSDHRQSTAGGPDWLANVKHWLGQAVSGHAGRGAGPRGSRGGGGGTTGKWVQPGKAGGEKSLTMCSPLTLTFQLLFSLSTTQVSSIPAYVERSALVRRGEEELESNRPKR
jgi:hypothetical protein